MPGSAGLQRNTTRSPPLELDGTETFEIPTPDGARVLLRRVQPRTGDGAPVILVHGARVRSNQFRQPTSQTVVDALTAAGYDVWLLVGEQAAAFDLLFNRMEKVSACQSSGVTQNIINIAACEGADRELDMMQARPAPEHTLSCLWLGDAYLCLASNNKVLAINALNMHGGAIHSDFQRLRLNPDMNAAALDAI